MKGRKLDAATIAQKTTGKPESVKNLNLWGCDLEDVSYLVNMPQLEVISLSVNRIATLRDFAYCKKLQELYLRKNNIENIKEIKFLLGLPDLKVLWLHDNPCSQIPNYRLVVLKHLPNLLKLDDNMVTPEERALAKNINFSLGGYPEAPESIPAPPRQSFSGAGDVPNVAQYSPSQVEQPNQRVQGGRVPNQGAMIRKSSKRSHTLDAIKMLLQDLQTRELQQLQSEVGRLLRQ